MRENYFEEKKITRLMQTKFQNNFQITNTSRGYKNKIKLFLYNRYVGFFFNTLINDLRYLKNQFCTFKKSLY